jgi:hypothetical protein
MSEEGADAQFDDDVLTSKEAKSARDTVIAFVRNMANVGPEHAAVSKIIIRAIKREIPE